MSQMSRSARNRHNRRTRTTPSGTVNRVLLPSEKVRDHAEPITLRPSDVRLPAKNRRPGQDKGQGEWRSVSQNYKTPVTIDVRWSA